MVVKKFEIPAEAKPYTEALRELIRSGVRSSPALEMSPLVDLPAVQRVAPPASATQRADAFVAVLETVIRQRLAGKSQAAALTLFAYGDSAGMSMGDRYRKVAKLFNAHWTWENFRKEPLDRLLLEIYLALYREGQANAVESMSHSDVANPSSGLRAVTAGGNYALISREVLYNFPASDGEPREIIDVREIEATTDGMEVWEQNFYHWGKGPVETPAATLFGPGELSITHDSVLKTGPLPGRTYNLRVRFPKPLRKGERVRFAIYRKQDVRLGDFVRPQWHDGWCFTPVIETQEFTLSIRFPRGMRPSRVWHYEDLPEKLAPGVPTDTNTIEPDSTGFVSFLWREPRLGLSCGLEWEW